MCSASAACTREINDRDRGRHRGAENVGREHQVHEAACRRDNAERQRFGRAHPHVRQRTMPRAIHHRVGVALYVLIERERPARRQRRARQRFGASVTSNPVRPPR